MDIQLPQILFQIINFGVVAGALTFLLYKPVKKMLQERSNRIEEAQKAAEASIAQNKNIEEMKKKIQKQAEEKAAALVDEATKDAQARRKELVAQARKDAQAEAEKIIASAQDERLAILKEAKSQFESAVFAAVEKVIGSLDKKAQSKIIDTELENLLKKV
jgi:F-type H+-transporting ATPase subunit b